MPVGVGERAAPLVETRKKVVRQPGAAMRLAEDDRAVARQDVEHVHCLGSRSSKTILPAFITSCARPRPSR